MSYTKHISWRDHNITFDYELNSGELVLLSWDAGEIPCVVESQFIEKQLYKWLDKEFQENGDFYIGEFLASRMDKRYASEV